MRERLVIGNWKMNTTAEEAVNLIVDIKHLLPKAKKTVVCVPFTHIAIADEVVLDTEICIGAQNVAAHESGAFTGEVSAAMLASLAVEYVLVGHSERRTLFHESDEAIAKKVSLVLQHNMRPVFCCGESLSDRNNGNFLDIIRKQLEKGIAHLSSEDLKKTIIAYEPVWAIGTGETASPEQAQEVHAFIRSFIAEKFNNAFAEATTILYGGSVKPNNANELFACQDIDGGLIGGASLKAADFVAIVNAI